MGTYTTAQHLEIFGALPDHGEATFDPRELADLARDEADEHGCDGRGQIHHGAGALSWVTLCTDPVCMARREAAWARECGEPSDLDLNPSGLWCTSCELARRARITAQMEEISATFKAREASS